ncbi:MAG: hypothetical protein WC943_11880, partial [Elusimicrobiota bacterium]
MFWDKKKKDDELAAANTTPVPDIQLPNLKKEKEEKKKGAGVPIGGAAKPGAFVGAKGGIGAAARAAASAAAPQVATVGVSATGSGLGAWIASVGVGKFVAIALCLTVASTGFFVLNKKLKKKSRS